ncbi:MAG: hypothetical protein ABIH76_09350, partial [Candidatus Bathyarchaeota archaeon]
MIKMETPPYMVDEKKFKRFNQKNTMFFRSFYKLGLIGKEGLSFWDEVGPSGKAKAVKNVEGHTVLE